MAARIGDYDWAATPLGPPDQWPEVLRAALAICLGSSFPTAIYWGEDLRLLYNDAWSEIPGERHPAALGRPAHEVWPDIWDVVGPQFRRVVETGEGFATYQQMLPMERGGRVRETYWNYSFTPLRDEQGRVRGVFNQGNEITAHVLGQRRHTFLLRLADRLRPLSDPDAIIAAAQELLGEHFGANRVGYGGVDETARYFTTRSNWTDGVPGREGVHDLAAFGPEVHASLRAGEALLIRDVAKDPRTSSPEVVAAFDAIDTRAAITASLVKDGRMLAALYVHAREPKPWTESDAALVAEVAERTWSAVERADAEQRVRELNHSLERRVAEAVAERERADALYRAYFEHSPEALFVVSVGADGRFRAEEVNPSHEAAIGLRAQDIRGKPIDAILPPELAAQVIASYRRVVASGRVLQYREVFAIHGEAQHWDTSLVPVRDSSGRITHLFGTSRNITRQVAAEEALRQAQKMEAMGKLTGGVAHDFNNLLTPIVGGLDLLQRRGVGGEREQRVIAGAIQSAERARVLVQRLLAFARRQPLQLAAIDVGRAVEDMTGLLGSTLGPRILLKLDIAAGLPAARADANQLDMALLNLTVNARDAMPDGGELSICVDRQELATVTGELDPGQYVRISVSDTGEGMDAATLARCTEPFFSTKGLGQGTGLGLSMVHGLAAQLGGTLKIFSQRAVGTTIELWLPATADATEPDAVAPESPAVAGAGCALVVDDEELVRASTRSMLEDLGYTVTDVGSAQEALAVLERGEPVELLVSDHLMPAMTGSQLAYEVRQRWPHVRLLIVSGYADVESIAPDLPRLTKPFRLSDLSAALQA